MTRIASLLSAGVACAAVVMVTLCWDDTPWRDIPHSNRATLTQDVSSGPAVTPDVTVGKSADHPIIIRRPEGPPLVELTGVDPQGRSGKVACSTCHSVRKPDLTNRSTATLNEFHQGLQVNHGKLACYACHNPDQSDALRLADGSLVEYRDVMTLCSQCHSAQATSFAHGAHGGMNGHWDLSRGSQTKNNCIDCHDPHAPSYPKMVVGFKPRDRFLEKEVSHDAHE